MWLTVSRSTAWRQGERIREYALPMERSAPSLARPAERFRLQQLPDAVVPVSRPASALRSLDDGRLLGREIIDRPAKHFCLQQQLGIGFGVDRAIDRDPHARADDHIAMPAQEHDR